MSEENRELNIDWSKFKSKAKGKMLDRAKRGYIEFCRMLDEVDFELVTSYIGICDRVEVKYRFDDNVKLNISPDNFKCQTHKNIINFKNSLNKNNDKFIKFVGLTDGYVLVSQIETFDNVIVEVDIRVYNSFNKGRQNFYSRLKQINGYTTDSYINNNTKMNIYIDNIKLNPMSPNKFKRAYKSIIEFKSNLIKNKDKFIKFAGLTNGNSLIAEIKAFDNGIIKIDISAYSKFTNARQDFYDKLKEVNGHTGDYYKGADIKMNIYIDNVKLNPIKPSAFKQTTYKSIVSIKNNLVKNNDEFIKFVGLTNDGNLIAKIKTFDGGRILKDINSYNQWNKSRQDTYRYCKEKGYRILSPYISASDKILIDFNCGHEPNWITPNALKQNKGCPVCNESKGEKAIRAYLEDNNIEFIQEYRFDGCKYRLRLPFDFYIPSLNLCIEYDGEQHYKAFNYFGGEEKFKLTQKRDKIKNNYCEDNGINLLRIPYLELDSIEDILDEEFEKLRELKETS